MKGIELYGKDWKKVQQLVGTRTSAQSRSHAQKVLPKIMDQTQNNTNFAAPLSPNKKNENALACTEAMVEKASSSEIPEKESIIKSSKSTEKRKFSEIDASEIKPENKAEK